MFYVRTFFPNHYPFHQVSLLFISGFWPNLLPFYWQQSLLTFWNSTLKLYYWMMMTREDWKSLMPEAFWGLSLIRIWCSVCWSKPKSSFLIFLLFPRILFPMFPGSVMCIFILCPLLSYQADPNSVDFRKVESPSRFRRMTLPHSNLAACDLHRLRQSAGSHFKSERSASTSTSGYAGSSDSNHISLIGNTLRVSRSQESQRDPCNNLVTDEERRRSSSAMGGVLVREKSDKRSREPSSSSGRKGGRDSSGAIAEEEEEKNRLAKFLSRSTRRASRPFRRAKTLIENHLNGWEDETTDKHLLHSVCWWQALLYHSLVVP